LSRAERHHAPGNVLSLGNRTMLSVRPRSARFSLRPDERRALGFILPLILIEILLVACPLALGFYYSFFKVEYFQLTSFRGIDNYWRVLTSPMVLGSVGATVIFSSFALVLTLTLGMALAMHLERDNRWNVAVRAVALVPYVISMLVGSLLLRWIFSTDAGFMAVVLGPVGLSDHSILGNPGSAMAALVFNAVWRDSAFAMIVLLAGLKSIPPQLYDAARVDGASAFYRFRRITLPLMRLSILIAVVRLLIHFVNVLTFSLILTGGGPNGATRTTGLALYELGFVQFRLGDANALAILVFLFNLALVAVNLMLFRERRRAP
jgi:multiple sugar transport system permease protein